MKVYVLYSYDDGVLGVYKTEERAQSSRKFYDVEGYYYWGDMVIYERELEE